MEVISIEAATFEEMKQALSSIIRDIRTGRGIRQEERLTEWMDNQEACIMMDISPRKLLTLRSTGKIPYSRIDRKIYYRKKDIVNMAHDLLTRESPEIIRFFQDIGHITELLRNEPDRYRPVLNGDRYITEAELSESLKITRRTLVEHRTTGLIPYYRLGGRILYKEKDIIKLLDENRLEAF